MGNLNDEATLAAVLEQAKQTLDRTGDPEAVMQELREIGCGKVKSIIVMRKLLGISLGEAKQLVSLSDTWHDRFANDEAFHDQLEADIQNALTFHFQSGLDGILPTNLAGFFVGWPNPPSPETLYRLLAQSYRISLAVEEESGRVVGFAQAIGDGVLTAFIPLLEVLPEFQGRGLGTEIMRHLLAQLDDLYAVDLSCDADVAPFYEQLGLQRAVSMFRRQYAHQNGRRDEGDQSL